MGYVSRVGQRIRQILSRDKEGRPSTLVRGTRLASPDSYNTLSTYGYDALSDWLKIEYDLMARFVDYEEMDEYPEVSTALTILADDATQLDTIRGKTVWIDSKDVVIKERLTDLFDRTLRIEEDIWEISRTVCKYGNDYEELVLTENGVVGLNFMPPPTVRRVETEKGELLGFLQDLRAQFTMTPEDFKKLKKERDEAPVATGPDGEEHPVHTMIPFEDFEVVHFRMRGKHRRSIYGFGALESARWIWKRLMMMEDAALIYRLSRAPSRYAFYVDVGQMPPKEAMSHVNKFKNQLKKAKFVDPQSGKINLKFNPLAYDEDFFVPVRDGKKSAEIEVINGPAWQHMEDIEYFRNKLFAALMVPKAYLNFTEDALGKGKGSLCLHGDTEIPLLNGRSARIADLANGVEGERFWVYSIDVDGNVVPGTATAKLTRRDAELVEVGLDDGGSVKVTPDHPVMMRDGSYRRADELVAGDSLMPLNRRLSKKADGQKIDGYEQVMNPADDKWVFTHRVVAEFLGEVAHSEVVHHKDFDKSNNDPDNLKAMDKAEHYRFHVKHAEEFLKRPDVQQKRREAHEMWLSSPAAAQSIAQAAKASKRPGSKFWDWLRSDEHRQLKSRQLSGQWRDGGKILESHRSVTFREKMAGLMLGRILAGTSPDTKGERNARWREDASLEHLQEIAKSYRCRSWKDLLKWSGYSSCLVNRVLAENGMSYREFARQFMPDWGARGADQRGLVNHKVVFVRKVDERADTYDLTVDGFHNFAVGAGIFVHNSQEDVRFCRTVLRMQRELRNGFKKIARVHLAAIGIDAGEYEYDVVMTVPSAIFELAQIEVKLAKLDFADKIKAYVSEYWILSKVLGFSDDEILLIEQQKKHERQVKTAIGVGQEQEESRLVDSTRERQLMAGSRDAEKFLEDHFDEVMGANVKLRGRVAELSGLMEDLRAAVVR